MSSTSRAEIERNAPPPPSPADVIESTHLWAWTQQDGQQNHGQKPRERGFSARSLKTFSTLGGKDAREGQAIGATASLADRISLPLRASGLLTWLQAHDAVRNAPVMCAYIAVIVGEIDRGRYGGRGELSRQRINRPAQSLHDAALKKPSPAVIGIPISRRTIARSAARVTHRFACRVRWWVAPRCAGAPAAVWRAAMSDKVEIFRARIVSLGLSHSAVDRILGKAGYTNKVMNGKKRLGAKVEAELCDALALKPEFVVDGEREAMMQSEWERWRRK